MKVVCDAAGRALYFSRAPIPYPRQPSQPAEGGPDPFVFRGSWRRHIGLYAYRRSFLMAFAALPQTPLETTEALEQLRALEHGFRIRTPETVHDSLGVDTPEDLTRARRQLEELAASARK